VLESEIEWTTTDDVIQIDEEFNRTIIINDQANTVMEDVTLDCAEEKADKAMDSKYLQPRWLAEMREKD
jgi:hypothetical protein